MATTQNCKILNTFNRSLQRQYKMVSCVSTFDKHLFLNFLAKIQPFLHLAKTDSIVFDSYITFRLTAALSMIFVCRVSFGLQLETNPSVRHGLMLLWFTDLVNVTKEVTIHRSNILTLLSSAFIRGDLNTTTRGPFTQSLFSCLFPNEIK